VRQGSRLKTDMLNDYSKGVMKRIINNETWNALIECRYNHSHLNKSKGREEDNIRRTRSLNSSNLFSQAKNNLPRLKPSESAGNKGMNKIKKSNINMI
jgi:hypothetical protein